MEIKKRDITIDELLILSKMNKSFSINGFKDYEFLDIIYRDENYYVTFISKDNHCTTFAFNNFITLQKSLMEFLKEIYFDRNTLNVWK